MWSNWLHLLGNRTALTGSVDFRIIDQSGRGCSLKADPIRYTNEFVLIEEMNKCEIWVMTVIKFNGLRLRTNEKPALKRILRGHSARFPQYCIFRLFYLVRPNVHCIVGDIIGRSWRTRRKINVFQISGLCLECTGSNILFDSISSLYAEIITTCLV